MNTETMFKAAVHYNNLLTARHLYSQRGETAEEFLKTVDKEQLVHLKKYEHPHRKKIAEQFRRAMLK